MSDTAVNTGFVPAKIDGKDLLLSDLSAEGMSTIASYIMKSKQPASVYSKVLATIDQVPGDALKEKMLMAAMKADHEESMRDRFIDPKPPMSAFFDDDVMALALTLSAAPMHPEYTLERCKEIAARVTGPVLLGILMKTFPVDYQKKGLGSSDASGLGVDSIGLGLSRISIESPKAVSI